MTLVFGPETVLAERAVDEVVAAARAVEPSAYRSVIRAGSGDLAAALADALAPNLFGESTVVVVEGLDGADEAAARLVKQACTEPVPGLWLVLLHPGGTKGKALLDHIRKAGAVEVACPALKRRRDVIGFLGQELRRESRRARPEALEALLDAVGMDLQLLVGAIRQLVRDVETDPLDIDDVHRYFGGVADVSGFAISDAVWERRTVDALADLRWAAESGDRGRLGPATVGAMTTGLRGLVRYAGASKAQPEAALAAAAGVPPWKLRSLQAQLRRWRPEQIVAATKRLAQADAAVKGGLREGEQLDPTQKLWALERLVVELSDRDDAARS